MFNTEIFPSTLAYILIFIVLIAIASVQLWYGRKKKDCGPIKEKHIQLKFQPSVKAY